jgi:hypothetical protein
VESDLEEVPIRGEKRLIFAVCWTDSGIRGSLSVERRTKTYYADDETRETWAKDFEDMEIPPKKPLPWDRDRTLPTIESILMGGNEG